MKYNRMSFTIRTIFAISLLLNTGAVFATCTSIVSLPITISASGDYCFGADLTYTGSGIAVSIMGSNISIDLQGNRLTGGTGGYGFYVNSNFKNVTVRNGHILNFQYAVRANSNTSQIIFEDLVITDTASYGVYMHGDQSVVRNNTIRNVGLQGISVASHNVLIEKNFVTGLGPNAYGGINISGATNPGTVVVKGNTVARGVGYTNMTRGALISGSARALFDGNQFSDFSIGLQWASSTSTGKYMNTLTSNVPVLSDGVGGLAVGTNN